MHDDIISYIHIQHVSRYRGHDMIRIIIQWIHLCQPQQWIHLCQPQHFR